MKAIDVARWINIAIIIVNTLGQKVGGSTTRIIVPSQNGGTTPLVVFVSTSYGILKEARLYFDFPSVFSYGPVVMPIG